MSRERVAARLFRVVGLVGSGGKGKAMSRKPGLIALVGAWSLVGVGCGGPVVSIRHVLPPDFPAPYDVRNITCGQFVVVAGPEDTYGVKAAEMLSERLRQRTQPGPPPAGPSSESEPVSITGKLYVETKDRSGVRTIQVRDPRTSATGPRQVNYLIRTAAVRVDFVTTRVRDDFPVGTVLTRKTYSSLSDPRVRGELGMSRPDDPANVPDVETVVAELLAECVDEFCGMIRPYEVTATVPLHGTLDPRGREALAAAERGDYQAALTHCKAAAASHPGNPDLLFNLAVLEEAAGDLRAALAHYQEVARRTQGGDEPTQAAIDRIPRVLARREAKAP